MSVLVCLCLSVAIHMYVVEQKHFCCIECFCGRMLLMVHRDTDTVLHKFFCRDTYASVEVWTRIGAM